MALLTVRTYPDPVLRELATPVTEFNEDLELTLNNMAETMYHENGIGLAATQVAILKRMIVVDVSAERSSLMKLINPEIIYQEGTIESEEGCLSVPDYRECVKRSEVIRVKYNNSKGENLEFEACDLLAICIQHEIDHLDGKLFIDHISRLKRDIFKRKYKKKTAK